MPYQGQGPKSVRYYTGFHGHTVPHHTGKLGAAHRPMIKFDIGNLSVYMRKCFSNERLYLIIWWRMIHYHTYGWHDCNSKLDYATIIATFMVESQKIILKGKLVEYSQIKARKPINILTAKFNNKKLPLPWRSGPLQLGGQWPVWPVVKTALIYISIYICCVISIFLGLSSLLPTEWHS